MWSRCSKLKMAIWLTVAAVLWGLASSNTLIHRSRNCWHHRHITWVDMTSGPYISTRRLWMLAGHILFPCPVFNTALCWHRLHDEGRMSDKNEEGCLWTQNTVTLHQFYEVPGEKKLIFWLSFVCWLWTWYFFPTLLCSTSSCDIWLWWQGFLVSYILGYVSHHTCIYITLDLRFSQQW
jgi:hypothetical protein